MIFFFCGINYFNYFKSHNNILSSFFLGEDIIKVICELITINRGFLLKGEAFKILKIIKNYNYKIEGNYYSPILYKGLILHFLFFINLYLKVFIIFITTFLCFMREYKYFSSNIFCFKNLKFLCKDILNFLNFKLVSTYKLNYWLIYDISSFMFCFKGFLIDLGYLNIFDVFIYKLIYYIPGVNYPINFILSLLHINFSFFNFFLFSYLLNTFFKAIFLLKGSFLYISIYINNLRWFIEYVWCLCSFLFFIKFWIIKTKFLFIWFKNYFKEFFFRGGTFFFLGFLYNKKANLYGFFSPIIKIKKKINILGFCFYDSRKDTFKIKACLRYFNKNHKVIIFFLSSLLKSILLYYRVALNLNRLIWGVRFILWISLGLLIKCKFKLLSLQQIINTFGVGININLSIYPLFYIKFKNCKSL